jgi:hypothetical protein
VPAKWLATREMPLDDLQRFPGNARRGDVAEIRKSIRRHGQYRAIVVRVSDGEYTILAGNHTAEALTQLGASPPALAELLAGLPPAAQVEHEPSARALLEQLERGTVRCELIECSDDEARRINLADNRTGELPDPETGQRYDGEALAELLAGLDGDLEGTGWAEEDLTAILGDDGPGIGFDGEGGFGDGDDPGGMPDRGELLALSGVTLGEPRHKVEAGQVWALGEHRLVIADVFTGWEAWAPLLDGDVAFLPYPTPLAPHAPGCGPLVMVQPEPFLAGHLLDKWQNITGAAPVVVNAPSPVSA